MDWAKVENLSFANGPEKCVQKGIRLGETEVYELSMKYGAPPSIWKRLPKIMNITEANSWAHGLNGGMNLLFQLYDFALDEPESRAID